MVAIDFTLNGVSIPTGTSASVTIYEDVGNDGGANSETVADGYTVSYDNKDTVALSDATTSYTTADVFDGSSGNSYQIYVSQDNTDVTVTAEETFDLTLENIPAVTKVSGTSSITSTASGTGVAISFEGTASISSSASGTATGQSTPATGTADITTTASGTAVGNSQPVAGTASITSSSSGTGTGVTLNIGTADISATASGSVTAATGENLGVQYRVTRNQTEVEENLFDVEIVDTANPFGNYAIAYISDNEGNAFENYSRGTRVDFAYSTNGGVTYTNRFTGYVVERRELDRQGADSLEVECYSFDQFLRRDTVSTDLSGQTIASALESIVKNDTPVSWNANNVEVSDPQTLTQSYRGDKVENAIQNIAAKSGNEAFGVESDLEFYFRPRENAPAPRDIDNTQWFNYDIPERGKGSVNQVTVYFKDGNESVTVDDGGDKLDLQDSLGTGDPITFAEEVNRPELTDIDDARTVANQILSEREPTLTGTVTTYNLLDADPGDVINIEIIPRGIDGAFRIAEIEYNWGEATTTLTIVEKRGNQDRLLVNLSDTLKRTEMQGANRDVAGNIITGTSIGATVTPSGDADGNSFINQTITNTARNKLRDAWAGDGNLNIAEIAVGDGTSQPTRTDTSLGNELERVSVTESLPDSTTARYTADVTTTTIREIGLFDSAGDLISRALIDDVSLSSPVSVAYDLTVSNDASIERGVLTTTGQTSVRDTIADNTPNLPANYAYGTDGTSPTEGDTALGNQVVSVGIDELLIQNAGDTTEWEDITTADDTLPYTVENGKLKTLQSAWTVECENTDSQDGASGESNTDASAGSAIAPSANTGSFIQWNFTNEYEIALSNLSFDVRRRQADIGSDGSATYYVYLDGTKVWEFGDTQSLFIAETFDADSSVSQLSSPLEPGTHSLRIETIDAPASPDIQYFDVIAPYDNRYNYTAFDSGSVSGRVAGRELYPDLQEVTFSNVQTRRNLNAASVTQAWNDTSNNQKIELSNDGGSTWNTTNNSQTASVTFSSSSTQVQTRVGISRFGSSSTNTPTQGFNGQEVDTHELFADIAAIVPGDIGEAEVQAIVSPNTITGTTIRESGELDASNNLLTRSIFAEQTVEADQRVISSETVTWRNPD